MTREHGIAATTRTATPSLRWRVTATVLGLFTLLLVLVGVLVDVVLGAQLTRDLQARLSDRVTQAVTLAQSGATPQQLVSLQGQEIRVRVVTADGDSYGDPGLGPPGAVTTGDAPTSRPAGKRGGGREGSRLIPPAATSTTVTRTLADGSRITLVGDTTAITDVRDRLRWVMAVAAAVAVALAAVGLRVAVGAALAPLDRLTGLARRITAGDRGSRLEPDRPGSELGRAAAAFDNMLDALEYAESRARTAATQAESAAAETRRFLSDAAHELRTPLAGIQALAESITRATDWADPRQRNRAELLMAETGQAAALVADMLDLARIDHGIELRLDEIDLVTLAMGEAERIRVLAPTLTVTTRAAGPLLIRADSMRISQILTNLGANAACHTPPDGQITIEVTGHGTDHGTGQGGVAMVTVANTGPTIPDAEQERIFGRLVRLQDARDRDSGGVGLGLSIARSLARAHGGDLVCLPAEHGASFRLTLPRPDPTHTRPDRAISGHPPVAEAIPEVDS